VPAPAIASPPLSSIRSARPHPAGARAGGPRGGGIPKGGLVVLNRDELKEDLLQTDDEFRRLYAEHQEYERRLELINQKTLPSEADEVEAKRIKLHKLALKDRMEQILRAHSEERVMA
jgi:uncharacterized protein YdcH (DUF465 family)